ncbi:MAG: SH3 domain-containing protein [Pseudomonadota bacterium]
MRFVLISLVVLVFAFYELSGGKDFVPRSETRRLAAEQSDPTPAAVPSQTPKVVVASLQERPVVQQPTTSRAAAMAIIDKPAPSANATVLTASATPGALYPAGAEVEQPEITLVSLEQNPTLFAQPLNTDRAPEADEGLTVSPSLAAAVASPVTAAPNPEAAPVEDFIAPQRDVRMVNGNRVNMRNGPGTSYSILARLNRDARVEVLADPGDGWVKLRPLNGGPTGWMADYLLTSTNG